MPNRCGINKIRVCFRCVEAIKSVRGRMPMYSVVLHTLDYIASESKREKTCGNFVVAAVTVAVAWNAKHWTVTAYFHLNQKINMTKKFVRINVYVTASNEFKFECGRVWHPQISRMLNCEVSIVDIFALIILFAAIDFNRFCCCFFFLFWQMICPATDFCQKILAGNAWATVYYCSKFKKFLFFPALVYLFSPLITNHWQKQWNGMWLHKAEPTTFTSINSHVDNGYAKMEMKGRCGKGRERES